MGEPQATSESFLDEELIFLMVSPEVTQRDVMMFASWGSVHPERWSGGDALCRLFWQMHWADMQHEKHSKIKFLKPTLCIYIIHILFYHWSHYFSEFFL